MNHLKTIVLTLWCTIIYISASAVVIEGTAPSYEGSTIKFMRYDNYVTKSLQTIAQTTVSEVDASFKVEFETDVIFEIWVEINDIRAKMYVQPEGTYKIIFPRLGEDEIQSMGKTTVTELYYEYMNDGDINLMVFDFNDIYDLFFIAYDTILGQARRGINSNYVPWQREAGDSDVHQNQRVDSTYNRGIDLNYVKLVVDTFANFVTERYKGDDPTGYFDDHVRYVIAELQASTFASSNFLYNNYIKDQEPLYGNEAYMEFIQDFYDRYIHTQLYSRRGDELLNIINNEGTADDLIGFIAADSITGNRALQEVIAIQGLGDVFHNEELHQQNILNYLHLIAIGTEYEENRQMANAMIRQLTYLTQGFSAPEFTLTDLNGDTVSLSDFKGKWVYLGFWTSWCKQCVSEMNALPEMYRKYKKQIEFISVSMDEDIEDARHAIKGMPEVEWPVLYAGEDSEIAEAYNILAAPEYVMIDPDGNILHAPAYKPTPDGRYITIDKTFHEIYWSNK